MEFEDEDDTELTEEEESLRDKWLHPDERDLIPGSETSFMFPEPLPSEGVGYDAYEFMRTVIPVLRRSKQTLFGKHGLDSITLWRKTRSADGRYSQFCTVGVCHIPRSINDNLTVIGGCVFLFVIFHFSFCQI